MTNKIQDPAKRKDYLSNIIRWHNEGKLLELNLRLVREKGGFETRQDLLRWALKNNLKTKIKEHIFKAQGRKIHAPNMDKITFYKNL